MHMDKHYIEEHDILRRYQQKRLDDEELEAFEIFILENPSILVHLEEEKAFHEAVRSSADMLERPTRHRSMMWIGGLAASLLLAFATLTNLPLDTDTVMREPVTLQSFRGVTGNTVQLEGQPVVQFRIDVGPPEFLDTNAFTARLVDETGNVAFSASGLQADADGWLIYPLAGQRQELIGAHTVQVHPDENPAAVTSFQVEFLSP